MGFKPIPPTEFNKTTGDAGKAEPQILSYPALTIDYALCDNHPAQQVLQETRGQNEETEADLTTDLAYVLQYMDDPKSELITVTELLARSDKEGVDE